MVNEFVVFHFSGFKLQTVSRKVTSEEGCRALGVGIKSQGHERNAHPTAAKYTHYVRGICLPLAREIYCLFYRHCPTFWVMGQQGYKLADDIKEYANNLKLGA